MAISEGGKGVYGWDADLVLPATKHIVDCLVYFRLCPSLVAGITDGRFQARHDVTLLPDHIHPRSSGVLSISKEDATTANLQEVEQRDRCRTGSDSTPV